MSSFIIQGGTPLHGSVRVGGAKNASYKLMIAALLGSSESRLLNFSKISDVELVAEIIAYLGGKVNKAGERAIFIDPSTLNQFEIKGEHGAQGRFSTMFIPVLLAKFGQAIVPAPGGDKIGERPLDRHFDGLKALGAKFEIKNNMYHVSTDGLIGATYKFEKNTHTGTETMIMAAALAKGRTILENAAQEPEIDDLIHFLNKMGAWIRRLPNRKIEIEGVEKLNSAIYKIMPDRNEIVSYACAALVTKGDIIVENAQAEHLTAFLEVLDKIGAAYEVDDYGVRFYYQNPLKSVDITTEIHPGFMTDWQPLMATVLTQAKGVSTIHETIMSERFQYVEALNKMGCKIEQFQPAVSDPDQTYNFDLKDDLPNAKHAIKIEGPTELKPGRFKVVDLRHGATLILAAMASQGVSHIENIEQVDRGYEQLDERLRSMGANIQRVE